MRTQHADSNLTDVVIADSSDQETDVEEVSSISYQYTNDIERRQFDSNFKVKYQSEAFEYEPKVKQFDQWQQFKQWIIHWLNKFFTLTDKNQTSAWFDYLIKFLAFILVFFAVYFIAKALLKKDGAWIFGRDSQEEKIDYINVETKLHIANFKELIASSKLKNDYRLTVRFYYLWLLRKLSDKDLIAWDINKTNMDYQYEIKDKALRERYAYHCYVYDYIWYGEFNVGEDEFRQVETSFNDTFKRIDG